MTRENPDPAESGEPERRGPERAPTLTPFLAGAAVIAIVVIGIGLMALLRSGDGLTEEGRVGHAINGQNDALQRRAYTDYASYSCRAVAGTERDLLGTQEKSEAARGNRYIDNVEEIVVTGDAAEAKVTYHYTKANDDKRTAKVSLVREDGRWKVCSNYG